MKRVLAAFAALAIVMATLSGAPAADNIRTSAQPLLTSVNNGALAFDLMGNETLMGVEITGLTASGATLAIEGSTDGRRKDDPNKVWFATVAIPFTCPNPSTFTAVGSDGPFKLDISGLTNVRFRVSSVGTGTALISINGIPASTLGSCGGSGGGGGGGGGTASAFGSPFPSSGTAAGFEYLSSAPTLVNGQMVAAQTDINGNLKVNVVSGGGSNASVGSTASAVPGSATFVGMNVGGTLTGLLGTANGLAVEQPTAANLNATVVPSVAATWGLLAQNAATSGQLSQLMEGAVTTAAPTYSTGNSSPLSLDTAGNLRVNVTTGGGTPTAFLPGGTPIAAFTATTSSTAASIPSGSTTLVVSSASNTPNIAHCTIGGTAVATDQTIQPGGQFVFNATGATQFACITSTATQLITAVAGTGTAQNVAGSSAFILGPLGSQTTAAPGLSVSETGAAITGATLRAGGAAGIGWISQIDTDIQVGSDNTTNSVRIIPTSNVAPISCKLTVTTGGTAQPLTNLGTASIHGFTIKNDDVVHPTGGEPIWVNFFGTATAAPGDSFALPVATPVTFAGAGTYTTPVGFGSNVNVSVLAATSGHIISCVAF